MQQQTNQDNISAKLKEFYAKIQEMEEKAKDLRVDLEVRVDEEIKGMKEKNSKLYHSLEEMKNSSGVAFHEVREGLNKAAEALNEAIRNASKQFK